MSVAETAVRPVASVDATSGDADGRLLVVSNRLPLTLGRGADGWRAEDSAGGLATALGPVMTRLGGLWVGWPGEAPEGRDENREALLAGW